MGMDIYSNSGVVVPLSDATPSIFRKAKKENILKAADAVRAVWEVSDKTGLESVEDLSSLTAWVVGVAERLTNKEEGYIDSVALTNLFDILCEQLGVELPSFEFDYWTRSRISGWEVPTNTPCIVFSDSGLFEKKMTKEGKRLASILGTKEIESSTWTVMSV